MKFLIDMPLSPALAAWLGAQGHDAVHAIERGMETAQDSDLIALALNEERVIVTADLDYPRLLATARAARPGVILFRHGDYSEEEIRLRLARVLESVPLTDLNSAIVVIEKNRIRLRRLPVDL